MFRGSLSPSDWVELGDIFRRHVQPTAVLEKVNQVLISNFGSELSYTDWVRLGLLSSRLSSDLAVTQSFGKILRWDEHQRI